MIFNLTIVELFNDYYIAVTYFSMDVFLINVSVLINGSQLDKKIQISFLLRNVEPQQSYQDNLRRLSNNSISSDCKLPI